MFERILPSVWKSVETVKSELWGRTVGSPNTEFPQSTVSFATYTWYIRGGFLLFPILTRLTLTDTLEGLFYHPCIQYINMITSTSIYIQVAGTTPLNNVGVKPSL